MKSIEKMEMGGMNELCYKINFWIAIIWEDGIVPKVYF